MARQIGIVFQNYALFPHMTVAQNVAYGPLAAGRKRAEVAATVSPPCWTPCGCRRSHERLPRQLSGGQQQRVALARCLAIRPRILLLDEPFSALDKNLRLDMQIEVKRLQREFGVTTVLVTHDQEEALGMSDRIAVLSKGDLEQFGSPSDIYDRPASVFVNSFVGSTNFLPGTLAGPGVSAAGWRRRGRDRACTAAVPTGRAACPALGAAGSDPDRQTSGRCCPARPGDRGRAHRRHDDLPGDARRRNGREGGAGPGARRLDADALDGRGLPPR